MGVSNKEVDLRRKYNIGEQLQALEFLDSNRRVYDGKLIPHYTEVAELMDIDKQLLHLWWKQRDRIMERGKNHLELSQGVKAFKLNSLTDKAIAVLKERDFSVDSLKDVTQALKTFIQYGRLLANKSTANSEVKHNHSGRVEYVTPDTEISYEKESEDAQFTNDDDDDNETVEKT